MKFLPIIRIIIALTLICTVLNATAASMSMEIIPLQHRSAEELIPVLRPFLIEKGTLTGTGYQLIVRTTPDNLVQLRDILKRLDTAPRRLVITVKQSVDSNEDNREAVISGQAQLGSDVSISSPDNSRGGTSIEYRNNNTHLRTRVTSTTSRSEDDDTQQIQVLEGHEALIQVGQSVPILERSFTTTDGIPVIQDQLAYKDVLRGFYVLPRINGDQVTLDISPNRDTLSQEQGGVIDIQRMHTTVSGRLGEWLEIGGSAQEEHRQDSAYTQSAHTGSRDQRRVLLRVEELRE